MADVIVSLLAQSDQAYIVRDLAKKAGQRVAAKYAGRFQHLYELLEDHPEIGAHRSSLAKHVRIGVVSPYTILYRYDLATNTVTILVHASKLNDPFDRYFFFETAFEAKHSNVLGCGDNRRRPSLRAPRRSNPVGGAGLHLSGTATRRGQLHAAVPLPCGKGAANALPPGSGTSWIASPRGSQ